MSLVTLITSPKMLVKVILLTQEMSKQLNQFELLILFTSLRNLHRSFFLKSKRKIQNQDGTAFSNGLALKAKGFMRCTCSVNNHIYVLVWVWWWKYCHRVSMATDITKSVELRNNDFVPYIEWKFYLFSWANFAMTCLPCRPLYTRTIAV